MFNVFKDIFRLRRKYKIFLFSVVPVGNFYKQTAGGKSVYRDRHVRLSE